MTLPERFALSLKDSSPERYMSFTGPDKLLQFGPDEGVLTETVNFALEEAQNGLVHIRSSYNNLYWVREIESDELLSVSAPKPVEDSTKVGCTLFRPNVYSGNWVSFQHVRSQLNVVVQKTEPYYLTVANAAPSQFFFFINTLLLKLPKHVAFKGDNGKFLSASTVNNRPFLQFLNFETAIDKATVFKTFVTRTGDVRFKSLAFDKLWRSESSKWVMADYGDESYNDPNNPDTLFQPVISIASALQQGIALCCRGNNNFCKRLDEGGMKSCLATKATSQNDKYACLEAIDPSVYTVNVTSFRQGYTHKRDSAKIVDRWEIRNESKEDQEFVLNEMCYYNKRLEFSNGVTQHGVSGKTTTFNSRLPFINEYGQLEIPDKVTTITNLSWRHIHDLSAKKEARVKVVVPAMTKLIGRLMARNAACEVPFSYTQIDQFATVNSNDGVLKGDYTYTVKAEIIESQPL
ncbi:uncharacterized protein LOC141602563 [Silene latifolia]|uniref:uncharacterized protein LOC141602563 n=1 Tax=Silene latifolia TaxID=37657 RepID=UPI003D76C4BF